MPTETRSCGLQRADDESRNHAAGNGGDQKRDNVGIERHCSGIHIHEKGRHRICTQTAQHAGAEDLSQQRHRQIEGFSLQDFIREAAEQRSDHAAGKRHEGSETKQIPQQACGKRHAYTPGGAEEHGAEDVHDVLHRSAAASENREG